jgi:glycosyltransferase involved in cell wall biosynthesis
MGNPGKRRKTVLFFDHATALGGAEFSLLTLASGLGSLGWDVHLGSPVGKLLDTAIDHGLQAHDLDFPRLRRSNHLVRDLRETAGRIHALADKVGAQILIANTVRSAVYTAFGSRRSRIPWIWYMRDFWLSESAPGFPILDRLGKRILGSSASRILANSHAVAANLPGQGKISVIHNGIDPEWFSPSAGPFDFPGLPSSADRIVVGMIGRLRPWKGIEKFIRTAAAILEVHRNAFFLVVGGDPFDPAGRYVDDLNELTQQFGLKERVVFTGHLDDVRPALSQMDVFVHPGDPEPFGRVMIEAMAMQLPVIAFNHGAAPEIVLHEKTGILVPPGDESGFQHAILDLIRSPEDRNRMGRAGRMRVERTFHEDRMISEVAGALEGSIP